MNSILPPDSSKEPDLIDRIAHALPEKVRSDYYRELVYCRSLPENDEMLRLLRAMQFLTLLMIQVPADVTLERERLEQLFASAMQKFQENLRSCLAYQKLLDERLVSLPGQITKGVNPEVIATKINESLRQQFAKSTIPETAEALSLVAEQMKKTTKEFSTAASSLTDSYQGAVEQARQSIDGIKSSISRAAAASKEAAEYLSRTFHRAYWWFLAVLAVSMLVIGFSSGILFEQGRAQPPEQNIDAPHMDTPIPEPMPHSRKKP